MLKGVVMEIPSEISCFRLNELKSRDANFMIALEKLEECKMEALGCV